MIDEKKIPLAYIKKSEYPGSDNGIRYMLRTVTEVNEETQEEEKKMRVFIWPEPYGFSKTQKDLITVRDFPLTEEGKKEAVAWINAEHEAHPELYQSKILG